MGEFSKYTVWLRDTKTQFHMSEFTIYFRESSWDNELNSWVRTKHEEIELALDKYPSKHGIYRLAYLPVPYFERPDHKSFIDACDYQLNQSLYNKALTSNREGYISVVIPSPKHIVDSKLGTQRVLTINIEDNTTDARIAAFEHIQRMADLFTDQTNKYGDVSPEVYERKAAGVDEMQTVQAPDVDASDLRLLDASWVVNTDVDCPELLCDGWLEREKEKKFNIKLSWDSDSRKIIINNKEKSPFITQGGQLSLAYYLLVLQHPEGLCLKEYEKPDEIDKLEKEYISIYMFLKKWNEIKDDKDKEKKYKSAQKQFITFFGKKGGKLFGSTSLNETVSRIASSIRSHYLNTPPRYAEQIVRLYAVEKETYLIRADRTCFDLPLEVFSKKDYRMRLALLEESL